MLRDALKLAGQLPFVISMPGRCRNFLVQHGVPEDIIADLQSVCFADWVQLGPLLVVPMVALEEQNLDSLSACIDHGYLVLAGAANGDPVAVHCKTRRMVYASNELLWHGQHMFENSIHTTPFLYDDFWIAAASEPSFPWDCYEASNRWPA